MEYRKHTSLKDLAQALGVSIPTVSRALKDSPEISSELCAKAKKLAKEMNYRPNPMKCYELVAAKSKSEQEHLYKMLVEMDKYKNQ